MAPRLFPFWRHFLKKFFDIPLVRFLSSVKMALPMLLILTVLLAAGTIVESLYTASVAKRFVYDTWWFDGFLLFLGVNVLGSALSRWPWKRHQTGFVITHLGILCVLAGSWVTQRWAVDGQIALVEGAQGSQYQEDKPVLTCQIDSGAARHIPAGYPVFQPNPSSPFSYSVGRDGVIKVDQFFYNAGKVVGARASQKSGGTDAVQVKLKSAFAQETDWLFRGKEGYDRADLGPASVLFTDSRDWARRRKKESRELPANVLAILQAPDGLKDQIRKQGIWGPIQPIKVGQVGSTGWMDMTFQVAKQMERALPDIQYVSAPLVSQQEPQPAVHFVALAGDHSAEGWLGFEDQFRFSLGGHTWFVAYGPRKAALPFTVALRKFKLGVDPGTQNPASYTSDVEVLDPAKKIQRPFTIYMNHPLHEDGYTLYQASYLPGKDGKYTSVFSVGRDPGLLLKYVGALVMVLGIIFMFWFKNPAWKKKGTNAT